MVVIGVAGNWADRRHQRRVDDRHRAAQSRLDFTEPYYYTPAQMAAIKDSASPLSTGWPAKKVCIGEATTY